MNTNERSTIMEIPKIEQGQIIRVTRKEVTDTAPLTQVTHGEVAGFFPDCQPHPEVEFKGALDQAVVLDDFTEVEILREALPTTVGAIVQGFEPVWMSTALLILTAQWGWCFNEHQPVKPAEDALLQDYLGQFKIVHIPEPT